MPSSDSTIIPAIAWEMIAIGSSVKAPADMDPQNRSQKEPSKRHRCHPPSDFPS